LSLPPSSTMIAHDERSCPAHEILPTPATVFVQEPPRSFVTPSPHHEAGDPRPITVFFSPPFARGSSGPPTRPSPRGGSGPSGRASARRGPGPVSKLRPIAFPHQKLPRVFEDDRLCAFCPLALSNHLLSTELRMRRNLVIFAERPVAGCATATWGSCAPKRPSTRRPRRPRRDRYVPLEQYNGPGNRVELAIIQRAAVDRSPGTRISRWRPPV